VVVLERETGPGGRARGGNEQGFWIDSGPQLVGTGDRNLLSLVVGAGLADELLPLRPLALAQLHQGVLQRLPQDAWEGARRIPGVRRHQSLRLGRLWRLLRRFEDLLDPRAPEAAVRLDDRSVADFCRLYFGRSVLEQWVAPWLEAELQADPEQTSRVLLLLHLLARPGSVGCFRGGTGLLAEALQQEGEDRFSARVESVERRGDVYDLHVETPVGPEHLEADAVVVALPGRSALSTCGPLLETPERVFLAGSRTTPVLALVAGIDRAPLHHATRIRIPRSEGLPLRAAVVEPGSSRARVPEGTSLVTLMASTDWSRAHLEAPDDVVEKVLLGYMQRLFPGVPGSARFTQVQRHPRALPRFDVGRVRAIASFLAVQDDLCSRGRRLYFAGDHLVAPTMEGAVTSGLRAAEAVARDLGLASRAPGV
jgi:protoporphyrinogen oxidase